MCVSEHTYFLEAQLRSVETRPAEPAEPVAATCLYCLFGTPWVLCKLHVYYFKKRVVRATYANASCHLLWIKLSTAWGYSTLVLPS